MTDYYHELQVTRDAEPEVIEKAYRALALKYHPDTSVNIAPTASRKMQRLNAAYATLGDPARRRRYDHTYPATRSRTGWEIFWDSGLVGLYLDQRSARRGE